MRQRQELSTEMILWLQTTAGNRAVQRLLAKKKAQAAAATKLSRKPRFKWTWRYYWSLIVHLLSWMAVWKRR